MSGTAQIRSFDAYFSADYATARARFRAAVSAAHGRLDSLDLNVKGAHGEDLTIDIGWFGSANPRRVFIHSSGVHGVEAFAGSAIQLQWLNDGIPMLPEDAAIALVHVLNPYGMAWLRRVNENNVDLNRNFLGQHERYDGAPSAYLELDDFLNPGTAPRSDLYYLRAGLLMLQHGLPALRQAVARGQYTNPKGLFFGGKYLEDGPARIQAYMTRYLRNVERLVSIDVHTGLGPFSQDRLLIDESTERSIYDRIHGVFGDRVQPLNPERGVAYETSGHLGLLYPRILPEAQVYFATQEFGTYNSVVVLGVLRAENRWHHYGGGAVDRRVKLELLETFNPNSEKWRREVLHRGRVVIEQAMSLVLADAP